MGYESKIFVIEKSSYADIKEKLHFAPCIAMFDLGKMNYAGAFHKLFTSETARNTMYYIYEGNEGLIKDCYDHELTEATLPETIEALEKDLSVDYYRRISPVVTALKAYNDNQKDWGELAVLHYGY